MVEPTQEVEPQNCRYYANEYPREDEVCVVEVFNVVENGAYVRLLEYNNKEGLITPSEYSKATNMKSIHKAMKVGRQEVVRVLKVDSEKGYIDLSKKKTVPEEINACEEKYAKAKTVHSIMRTVAEKSKTSLEDLFKQIVWPLYDRYPHALDAFKISIIEWDTIFQQVDLDENVKQKLQAEIQRRLTPQALKIRADFEITCFAYEGIDAIKEALKAGKDKLVESKQTDIEIKVIAPPLFVAFISTFEKVVGIQCLNDSLKTVQTVIQSKQGNFLMKAEPRVVGEKDEKDIQDLIKDLENKRKGNDSDDEEEDEGMDADIGVDTEAIDKKQEEEGEGDDDDEESEKK